MNGDIYLNALAHHGVKGMKWGVRRKGSSSSGGSDSIGKAMPKKSSGSDSISKAVPRVSSDYKKVEALRGRPASTLSNKQLKMLNERLNLEQNYNRLNPTTTARGKSKVEEILSTLRLGVTTYNLVTSPATVALVSLGKKVMTP